MLKRWIALLMCLALVCSMLPVSALAEDTLPEVTEAPETTEVTEATEATEVTEATEATEVTEATEATEAAEATGAAEEESTEPTLLPPSLLAEEEPTAEEALRSALEAAGNWETVTLSEDLTLSADLTVPAQVTLEPTSTLTVPSGVTLTLNGSLLLDSGRLVLEDGSALVIGDNGSLRAVYDTVVTMGNNVTLSLGTGRVFLDNGITGLDGIPKEVCVRFVVPSSEAALQEAIQISGDYFHTNVNITNWAGLTAISGAVTIPQNMDVNLSMWGGETMSLTLQSGSALTVNGIFNTYSDTVLTVEDGASITVNAGGSMTVSEGATLVNHGTVTHGGNLIINGTLEGNAPVTSGPSNGDTVTTPEELLSAIAQAEQTETWTNIHVAADLVVPENVALGSNPERLFCHLFLDSGYTVTIQSGATLTVNTLVDVNGTLLVEDGGSLLNQCSLFVNSRGRLEVASGGTYDGTGMLSGTLDRISGVDGSRIVYQGYVASEEALRSALAVTGYGAIEVYPRGTITLTQDLTVPEGRVSVFLHPGSSLVVPDGITLVNQGGIYLFTESALCIQTGGTFDNQGYLGVNAENGLVCEGTYLGNAPDTGEEMSGISVTTLDDLKAAIAQAEQAETQMNILLSADLDISEDLEFGGNAMYEIAPEKTLTVKSGVTLTVSRMLFVGGTLHVEAGATLVNSDQIILVDQNGALSVSGTYIHQGLLVGTLEQITGVDGAQVTRTLNVFSEEELRDGAAITGYHSVDLILSEDITLTQDLTIPEGVSVHVCSDKTLTVPSGVTLLNENFISIYGGGTLWIQEGGTLNNQGRIHQQEDGTLTRDGTYTGNEPNASDPGGSDTNVSVTTLEELLSAIAQAEQAENWMNIHVVADLDVAEDLSLGSISGSYNCTLILDSGYTVTVQAGATLTVNTFLNVNGTIRVEAMGTLINHGMVSVNSRGRLEVASGGTYDGTGMLSGTLDRISGVDGSRIVYQGYVSTEQDLRSALAVTGYGAIEVYPQGTITLTQDLTVPEGRVSVFLHPGSSLVVPDGITLVNQGGIYLFTESALCIQTGGTFDNRGYLGENRENGLVCEGTYLGKEPNSDVMVYHVTTAQELSDAVEALNQGGAVEDRICVEADIHITGSLELQKGVLEIQEGFTLTVDAGAGLSLASPATLDVYGSLLVQGSLVNQGMLRVYDTGRLEITSGGTYTGSGTLQGDSSHITGIDASQITNRVDAFSEEELHSLLATAENYKTLYITLECTELTLTKDLTIPRNARVYLLDDVMTVPSGVCVRVEGSLFTTGVFRSGSRLVIPEGGSFIVRDPSQALVEEGVTLDVVPGTILVSEQVEYVELSGIPSQLITVNCLANSVDLLDNALAACAQFHAVNATTMDRTLTLTHNITIPANAQLTIQGQVLETADGQLVIPAGVTVTNYGEIVLDSDSILRIEAGGTLVNLGTLTYNGGTLDNQGTLTEGETPAHNVTTFEELKEAVARAGQTSDYLQISIVGDIEITESLYIAGKSNVDVYIEDDCTVTVRPGSTLTVAAWMGISGNLRVMETATLNNRHSIQVFSSGTLTVVSGGSYTGTGDLSGPLDRIVGIDSSLISYSASVFSDEELREALSVEGYGKLDLFLHDEITLEGNLMIPANATFHMQSDCVLVIRDGVTLVNEGRIHVYDGAEVRLLAGGTLNNRGTVRLSEEGTLFQEDGSEYLGNAPGFFGNASIKVGTLAELKSAIAQAKQSAELIFVNITNSFDITENLTLAGNASYFIKEGCSVTVPSGIILTVDAWLSITGSLRVESGAALTNIHGIGVDEGGSLTVETGGSYRGDGYLSGTLDQITGINPKLITYEAFVNTEQELRQALAVTGYGRVSVNLEYEACITLTGNLTIPKEAWLGVQSSSELVIPNGVTLTNNGDLLVWENSRIWIQEGGTLDNQGSISLYDDSCLLNEGTFTGSQPGNADSGIFVSTLEELEAALEELKDQPPYAKPVYVQADIVLTNDLQIGDFYLGIDEGATVTVPSGVTMTVSGNLGVGGSLLVSGKLENQGFVEVYEHGRLEICPGGAYTGYGTINGSKENVIGISASKLSPSITVYTVEELNQVLATASEYRQREIVCEFDGEAVLNRDLSIRSNDMVYIPYDGVLVIPEGITVKVDGYLYGNLRIMSGATLTVRGEGIVTILDQSISMAESGAKLNVVPGSIHVNGFEEIPGIPRNLITLIVDVSSQEQLEQAYALASEYAVVWAEFWDITLTLTGDLTIPVNGSLTFYGNMNIPVDAILEVPEGITLTNLGSIHLYDRSVLRICRGGSLVNRGDLVLGGGTLENLGSYTEGTVTGGSCGENLTWSLDEATGVLTIDGSGAMDDYAQEGAPWYGLREQITRVAMKQGSNIGANAFYGLTWVTEITLPRTLESFRDAFGTCTSLTRISFPDGNDHGFSTNAEGTMVLYSLPISAAAAYAMSRSTSGSAVCAVVPGAQGKLVIPEGVTTLASGAMTGCAGITEVSFPQNFRAIEESAMTGCSGIEKLVFPETLESIGDNAFSGCANLTQLVFTGPAPAELSPDALAGLEATVSYPANEESWQETVDSGLPEGITAEAKSVMIRITGADTLLAGKSTQLTASFLPEDFGTELVWSLEKGEDNASISQDGTLTAKKVTRRTQVTVLASAADGSAEPGSFTVTIVPLASGVEITRDFAEVTGQTLVVNLNEPQQDILLTARTVPEGCGSEVSWKVSDTKDAYGSYDIQGNSLTFAPGGKTGSVTFTATAADGSGETAKVIVKLVRYADRLEIQKAPEYILGGKSVTLTTDVASDKTLTDKKVVWSLDEESAPYASISASGKLTTKVVSERVTLYVTATLAADPSVSDTVAIRLYPAATAVELRSGDRVFAEGEKITWDVEQGTLNLDATSYPVDAMQGGTWSVSSKSIAEITQDGQVTFLKAGKVKITFTASDGSGKKATLNVTVTKKVADLTIEEPAEPVRAGKTLTLKATAWAADDTPATNQKFTWSLPDVPSSIATISSSGKVTVKDVSNQQLITVRVQSKENPEICAETEITLLPKYEKTLQLTDGDENLTGDTLSREPGSEALQIVPKLYLTEGGRETGLEELDSSVCTFSSSNKRAATIDAQGLITFVGVGNTTISAKYTAEIDGKSVVLTAKFSLNVAYRVHSVKIAEPADTNLRSGKSLTLKASALREDGTLATSQKMIWLSSNPDVATVSASGKVTAKNVTTNTQVTIKAASQESIYDEITLTIRPKSAYQMSLFRQGVAAPAKQTVPMDLCPIVLKDEMKALMYVSDPASDDDGQQLEVQEAAWTSSNKKVAEFDEAGNLLFKQPGSTNITASFVVNVNGRDTTVSAKVSVKVVNSVRSLTVSQKVAGQELVSGKKLQLVAEVNSDASNKKVTWTSSDPAVAKVSSSGLVTAGRVFEQQTVTITAKAQDGYGAEDSIELTVYPAATTVSILSGGQVLDNRTITVSLADLNSMKLSAVVYPDVSTGALQQVTWSSSNTRAASFDGSTLNLHRTGTVTIKATANDGSKKTVSFKLVITD